MSKRPASPLQSNRATKITKFFSSTSKVSLPEEIPPVATLDAKALKDLFALQNLKNAAQVQERFEELASVIFSQYRLRVTRRKENALVHTDLQLLEIEFYLISTGVHDDPFTHGAAEQRYNLCWYFHRPGGWGGAPPSISSGYRGGSRKGLDISLGSIPFRSGDASNAGEIFRGGILLRSVKVVSTEQVVSGPCLLVDLILKLSGAEDIKTLVNDHWSGDISALTLPDESERPSFLSLVPSPPHQILFYRSPRVGLDLGNPSAAPTKSNPRVDFVRKPYRYFLSPELLKVNGRPTTFLGLLFHVLASKQEGSGPQITPAQLSLVTPEMFPLKGKERSTVLAKIMSLGVFNASAAGNYLGFFETGIEGGSSLLGSFCGPAGKGACQSPEKLLKMFGAVFAVTS